MYCTSKEANFFRSQTIGIRSEFQLTVTNQGQSGILITFDSLWWIIFPDWCVLFIWQSSPEAESSEQATCSTDSFKYFCRRHCQYDRVSLNVPPSWQSVFRNNARGSRQFGMRNMWILVAPIIILPMVLAYSRQQTPWFYGRSTNFFDKGHKIHQEELHENDRQGSKT